MAPDLARIDRPASREPTRPLFARPVGWHGLALGLLLGFLPCGLLYAAIGAAIAPADPLARRWGWRLFTLGTFPVLWLIAYLGGAAQLRWTGLARRLMPVVAAFNAIVLGWMAWNWMAENWMAGTWNCRELNGRSRCPADPARKIISKADHVKRMAMPASGIPVRCVLQLRPAATGKARVKVPVVTISPAASGGLTGSSASSSTR